MLVTSTKSRHKVLKHLSRELRKKEVVVQVTLRGAIPHVKSLSWRQYWNPCLDVLDTDTRIIHRLNRLKAAWEAVLSRPRSRSAQTRYCWRYFSLLHHALRIAEEQNLLSKTTTAFKRIVGFEIFTVRFEGMQGVAAGLVCQRNPVYMLGRLPKAVPYPSSRHVPLVLPAGEDQPYYHYRQFSFSDSKLKLLLFPTTDHIQRASSFSCIDRFSRVTANRPDPYFTKRARLLTQRAVVPLFQSMNKACKLSLCQKNYNILDLGAGTGHLVGRIWGLFRQSTPALRRSTITVHNVDCASPSLGRAYGTSGQVEGIQSIEWTIGDYRAILDEPPWLRNRAHFHVAFLSRLLDNFSFFNLVTIDNKRMIRDRISEECLPHRLLAPRQRTIELEQLRIKTGFVSHNGGRTMPQFSLQDYFACMRAICRNEPELLRSQEWVLPVRKFNPAALITRSGQSVIAQLRRVSKAVIVEDLDLDPASLRSHMSQFNLNDSGVVQLIDDGYCTEMFHYVIAERDVLKHLKGKLIW